MSERGSVLVTGGAGYVGAAVVRALVRSCQPTRVLKGAPTGVGHDESADAST